MKSRINNNFMSSTVIHLCIFQFDKLMIDMINHGNPILRMQNKSKKLRGAKLQSSEFLT